jgi:hypothetical protein
MPTRNGQAGHRQPLHLPLLQMKVMMPLAMMMLLMLSLPSLHSCSCYY